MQCVLSTRLRMYCGYSRLCSPASRSTALPGCRLPSAEIPSIASRQRTEKKTFTDSEITDGFFKTAFGAEYQLAGRGRPDQKIRCTGAGLRKSGIFKPNGGPVPGRRTGLAVFPSAQCPLPMPRQPYRAGNTHSCNSSSRLRNSASRTPGGSSARCLRHGCRTSICRSRTSTLRRRKHQPTGSRAPSCGCRSPNGCAAMAVSSRARR